MNTYHVQESILAADEYSLYHALTLVVAQRALLLPKVTVSRLVAPTITESKTTQTTPSNFEQYVADFVLCDRATTRPIAIILIDDAKPNHARTALNDSMTRLCENAGLTVLRLGTKSAYRMDVLQRMIEPLLSTDPRGRDYEQGDRLPVNMVDARTQVAIPRPGTLFSAN